MTLSIEEILNHSASFFQHKGVKSSQPIHIKDILLSFKDGTYASQISILQELIESGNDDEYGVQKSKLPAVTFCGEFVRGHAKADMHRYNHILIIDIDKLSESEMRRVKECLNDETYVFSYWISPSRKGLKGLVYLYYNTQIFFDDISLYHKHAFGKVRDYFEVTHNIFLDVSGSDTCRLCFVSHDPDLTIKSFVTPFLIDVSSLNVPLIKVGTRKNITPKKVRIISPITFDKRHLNPVGKNDKSQKQEIIKIIKYLKKKNLSITETYDNWYRIALAIANSFSCDLGEKYFLEFCRLDGAKHDEVASKKLLVYSYNNSRGHIGFSTIVFLAKEKGYKTG